MKGTASVTSDSSAESKPSYAPSRDVSALSDLSGEYKQQSRRSVFTPLSPQPRKSNDLSDFTIDKLHYASLGFHGRDKELQLLKGSLDKLMSDGPPEQEHQLILISGYSGTGKTALANNALKKSTEKLGGLFVRGKFDLTLRNEPYSGIAAACADICGAMLKLKTQKPIEFEQLCSHIKTELGSELTLLLQVIPILAEIVECDDADSAMTRNANLRGMSSASSKNQFNFAFLRLIRAISKQFTPLIIVLDDLQWADGASLDLLEVILTGPLNSKLMIVGIYRSNEVDETHILYRTIEELKTKTKEKYLEMTQLEIGNLDFDAVHEIIKELLSMDNNYRTMGLADVCHKKTYGNAFFLLQFLSMLKDRQMLQFNFGTVSWTWDDKEIESCTSSSDNVVDLVKGKMTNLSKDLTDLLKLAACLGSNFEVDTLRIVWESSDEQTPQNHDALIANLKALEADGYFVSCGSESKHHSYSWGHDKIQEAALTMVPEPERGAFAANIGSILLSQLDEKDLDSAIFVVVDLLNGDDKLVKDEKECLALARLNYRASCRAISLSAFESVAEYAAKGIRVLPENAWVDHYDLNLNLHTIGAKAEGFIGNIETMERYCKQVLGQEDHPIEDKFDVYNTWIDSVMNRRLLDEAKDLLLEILKKFKCRFPPQNSIMVGLGIVGNVVRIKATLKSRDFAGMPILNDTTRIELMKLLDKLATVFYMTNDDRVALPVFRSLNWTVKYGCCDISAVTFSTTGMLLTGVLNDLQGGSHYGEQAVALIERSNSQTTAARMLFNVYSFLFPWTKPLRSLLKPLLRSYDLGLQTGDIDSATWAILHWILLKFQIGSSLEALEADSLLYSQQMKSLKREQSNGVMKYTRQFFLNLTGQNNADNPTHFSGDSISKEELACFREDPFFGPGITSYEGILFTYFGEHVRHADVAIQVGHDYLQKVHLAAPGNMWDTLFKGISCFAAARETGKRKYAKMGQIFRSKIIKWLDMGNPNVKHYRLLLDAEWMAYKGKKFSAITNYESSILLAARGGYQHDAALATERLGELYLQVMDDRENAAYQIGQSIRYWGEWGAMAKVHHLHDKYANLLPQPSEIGASSAVCTVSRLF